MPDQTITITAIMRDRVSATAKRVDDSIQGVGDRVQQLSDLFAPLTRQLGGLVAGLSAVAVARRGVDELRQFELGLGGVGKTADIEGPKLQQLGQDILELGTGRVPVAISSLFELAEAAGQLGIKGSDNILRFAETMARLERSSDLAGAAGATALARIIALSSTQIEQVDRVGSVITALGNNVAATESEIVNISTRVAQSTSQFKLGADTILAYGAALRALGVRAELGGNQIGRLFAVLDQAVRDGGALLDRVSTIAGQTNEQFQEAFAADPAQAVFQFLTGLRDLNEEGQSVRQLLDQIGLSGNDAAGAIIPLAIGVDELAKTLRIRAKEFENPVALANESGKAFDTLDSKIQKLRNAFTALFVNTGQQGGFASDLKGLVDVATEAVSILAGVEGAYDRASSSGRFYARVVQALVAAFRAFVTVRIVAFIGETLFQLGRMIQSMLTLNAVMNANPAALLANAFGVLAGLIAFFTADLQGATGQTEKFATAVERLAAAQERLADAELRRKAAQDTRDDITDDVAAAERQLAAVQEALVALRGFIEGGPGDGITSTALNAVTPTEVLVQVGIDPESRGRLAAELQKIFEGTEIDPRAVSILGLERLRREVPKLAKQITESDLRNIRLITNEEAIAILTERLKKLREEIGLLGEDQKTQRRESELLTVTEQDRFEPFLEALRQQRALTEAATDAERTRIRVLQEAAAFAKKEGFSTLAPGDGELSQHDRFIELVKSEIVFLLQAADAAKKRNEEEANRSAATTALEQFSQALRDEIELSRALAGVKEDEVAARQAITQSIELERLAQAAGVALTDEQIQKLRELIAEQQRATEQRTRSAAALTAQGRVAASFAQLREESAILTETAKLLRENEAANLSLNDARRRATEVVQLEQLAIAAGVEDVDALTRAYLEQVDALERRNRAVERTSFLKVLDQDATNFFEGFGDGFLRTSSQLADLGALGADVGASFVNALGGVLDALSRADSNMAQFAVNFVRQLAVMIAQAAILQAILAAIGLAVGVPTTLQQGDVPAFDAFSSIPSLFAEGGEVPGPDVRRDVVSAKLTPREWVIPVDSALYYGRSIMEAIRRQLIPREVLASATIGMPIAPSAGAVGQRFFARGGEASVGGARRSSSDESTKVVAYIPNDSQSGERLIRGGLEKPMLRWLEEKGFVRRR